MSKSPNEKRFEIVLAMIASGRSLPDIVDYVERLSAAAGIPTDAPAPAPLQPSLSDEERERICGGFRLDFGQASPVTTANDRYRKAPACGKKTRGLSQHMAAKHPTEGPR